MSCLTLVREACRRIGIQVPNVAISSTDTTIQQLVALANEEGESLAARHDWTVLVNEQTFLATAAEDQGVFQNGIVPVGRGFSYVLNDTMWNRTTRLPIYGPNSAVEWQAQQTLPSTNPYTQYRFRGNRLLFWPAPNAGDLIAFEFVSKNWCVSSDGSVTRNAWADDTDTGLLDEGLMLAGVVWRWKASKGLEYAEDFQKYEARVADAIARDGSHRTSSLNGDVVRTIQPLVVVPSGNWTL